MRLADGMMLMVEAVGEPGAETVYDFPVPS